jgi:hypothetical protein
MTAEPSASVTSARLPDRARSSDTGRPVSRAATAPGPSPQSTTAPRVRAGRDQEPQVPWSTAQFHPEPCSANFTL